MFFSVFVFFSVKPHIYQYFNETVREGSSVTLKCYSTGEPEPEMSFRKVHNGYDYDVGINVRDLVI